jgi:hypothetical protein
MKHNNGSPGKIYDQTIGRREFLSLMGMAGASLLINENPINPINPVKKTGHKTPACYFR